MSRRKIGTEARYRPKLRGCIGVRSQAHKSKAQRTQDVHIIGVWLASLLEVFNCRSKIVPGRLDLAGQTICTGIVWLEVQAFRDGGARQLYFANLIERIGVSKLKCCPAGFELHTCVQIFHRCPIISRSHRMSGTSVSLLCGIVSATETQDTRPKHQDEGS